MVMTMTIKDSLDYRNFFIRKLSVDLTAGEIKEYGVKNTNVSLGFGIATPVIVSEKDSPIAVFPFRIELETDEIKLNTEFVMGFEIINKDITDENKLQKLVNKEINDFIKFVNRAANQIVDNALEHSNIRMGDQLVIDPFQYKLQ